jgi:membrane protease YdiL (CAAX protease family)
MIDDINSPREHSSGMRRLFMNKGEIRAGWSIAIFVGLVVAISIAFILPMRILFTRLNLPLDGSLPYSMGAIEFATFLGVFLASVVMTRIEHKPVISYGLDGPLRFKNFVYGFLWGFLALSVLVAVMALVGFLRIDGEQIFGLKAIKYALEWGAVFILVGMTEEYMLRGYLLATLSRGIGFWWSAVILSVVFGSLHLGNHGESPVGIFSASAIGLIFCMSLWYQKTLWWAIGFHAAWDWAESYFWGAADSGLVVKGHLLGVHPRGSILWSGGATGPEGSMFIVFLLIMIALFMVAVWRNKRRGYEAVAE